MSPSFEIVIIGAGVIGCSTAWFAGHAVKSRSVLLIDRGFVGQGTTRHSPGHGHPHGIDTRQRSLCRRSLAFFDMVAGWETGLIEEKPLVGVLRVEGGEAVLNGYERGSPRLLPEDEARACARDLWLTLAPGQTLHCGGFTYVGRPERIAATLASQFRENGGQIWEGVHAIRIAEHGPRWRIDLADGRSVDSERIVVAIGAWLVGSELVRPFMEVGSRRKKICAIHLASSLSSRPQAPLIYFHDDDAYLMPRNDLGYTIFSFPSDDWDCGTDPDDLVIDACDRARAMSILERYAPRLQEKTVGARVSVDAYSADRSPRAWVDKSGRLVCAGLGSGYGFRLAPAVAEDAIRLLYPEAAMPPAR